MSPKLKSVRHTIKCVYIHLYDYRGEILFYKDFWKNKSIEKKEIKIIAIKNCFKQVVIVNLFFCLEMFHEFRNKLSIYVTS